MPSVCLSFSTSDIFECILMNIVVHMIDDLYFQYIALLLEVNHQNEQINGCTVRVSASPLRL